MQKLVNYIIRPKRQKYCLEKDLEKNFFIFGDKFSFEHIDFEVKNRRNLTLQCSLFHHSIDKERQYPLIVYCHGNSGNRTESFDVIRWMLRMNVLVVSFDFSGCGLSEGSYISLGYFEQNDIEDVLKFIQNNYGFVDQQRIGIWGRSMGAASSLLFAGSNPIARLLILDSPFADLPLLLKEYIDRFKIVSKIAGNFVYNALRKKVEHQANFDIEQVTPIKIVNNCSIPILFLHGNNDTVVPIHHSQKLFDNYTGEKLFLEVEQGHNDVRPAKTMENICHFIVQKFAPKVSEKMPFPKDHAQIKIRRSSKTNVLLFHDAEKSTRSIKSYFQLDMIQDSAIKLQKQNNNFFPEKNEQDSDIKNSQELRSRQNKRHNLFFDLKKREELMCDRQPFVRKNNRHQLFFTPRNQPKSEQISPEPANFKYQNTKSDKSETSLSMSEEEEEKEIPFNFQETLHISGRISSPRDEGTLDLDKSHKSFAYLNKNTIKLKVKTSNFSIIFNKKDGFASFVSSASRAKFKVLKQKPDFSRQPSYSTPRLKLPPLQN